MIRLGRSGKKEIASKRIRFFYQEVVWGFIIIFLLLLLPGFLIPLLVDIDSPLYGISFYLSRAILVLIGIPLIFPLSNLIFEPQKRNVIIEEDVTPAKGHLKLYKISKKNYKYQILYGVLIFFLVFLPIGFFTYLLVPGMLVYQSESIIFSSTGGYLKSNNYIIFLISAIIVQFSVAITEETVSRGLLAKRGSEHYSGMSAVIISALYFGFGHFAYFFDPLSWGKSIWYPLIWFLEAFIIGIILALLVLRRKWLFPVIIAHTLNNIIAIHAIWSFSQGISFSIISLYLYYPLLIIGCILFVWFYSQVKESLTIGFGMLKNYFKREEKIEVTTGDTIFRVFFDILMGFLIFLMGFIIAI
ncbi:MAG: CPBP family intramembrane metalloprotease [Promethearchaeota archaeon]|nr:MAG: CPBP family intramembrane metalloprotease [Candidatus Lokiarchaeota archaeon]